jgi:hypothetical protein
LRVGGALDGDGAAVIRLPDIAARRVAVQNVARAFVKRCANLRQLVSELFYNFHTPLFYHIDIDDFHYQGVAPLQTLSGIDVLRGT